MYVSGNFAPFFWSIFALNIRAWEAFEKGQDIHMHAAPSQAELLYKNYKILKEKLKPEWRSMEMLQLKKKCQGSFSLDKVRGRLNMIVLEGSYRAWYCLKQKFCLIFPYIFFSPEA